MRVISIPRHSPEQYDRLVSQIVRATNWQNVIKPSDLMSNDARQIELERGFRKLNYLYIRKRQVQSDARGVGFHYQLAIKKEELANALGACLEESLPRRVGLQPLFEEDYYPRIFSRRYSTRHYLCCFWHYRSVDALARGVSERQWAKYVVTFFLWEEFGPEIRAAADSFIKMREAPHLFPRLSEEYQRLLQTAFEGALRFYRRERGTGANAIELSPFFKRGDVYDGFEAFWPTAPNDTIRKRFERAAVRFRGLLLEPS